MSLRRALASLVLGLAGASCSHSDSYGVPGETAYGPFSLATAAQITFDPDQNYWPAWTADGRGIMYAFVDAESAVLTPHRCLGILPAAGGTRIWQLCDNRAVRNDTVSSYSGYALSTDGKLLVAEATAPTNTPVEPLPRVLLWLADTAKPYVRTTLLTLPVTVDGFTATWLAELQWTAPNQFLGLAQQLLTLPHCGACDCFPCPRDSVFGDAGMVVVGTVTGGSATLHAVRGTDSATSYSLAENGASIVFTRHHELRLFKVPIGGGEPVPLPIQRTVPDTAANMVGELTGVTCREATCLFAMNGIFLSDVYCCGPDSTASFFFAAFLPIPSSRFRPLQTLLQSMSIATGVTTTVRSENFVLSSPKISPASNDVVYQAGGVWGHLQTFVTAGQGNGHLMLVKGLVQ